MAPIEFTYVDEECEEEEETEEDEEELGKDKEDEEEESDKDDEETEEEVEEETEVEIIETVVNDEEIDDLIMKLNELKFTKESMAIELDDETELVLHHEDNVELEGEED